MLYIQNRKNVKMLFTVIIAVIYICGRFRTTDGVVTKVDLITKVDCFKKGDYFDPVDLRCRECPTNAVVEASGLSCECKATHFVELIYPALKCGACPSNQRQSEDGRTCVECEEIDTDTDRCRCSASDSIVSDRTVDGSIRNRSRAICLGCADASAPFVNAGGRQSCRFCRQHFAAVGSCICPAGQESGGVCLKETPVINSKMVEVESATGTQVTSAFFESNAVAARELCGPEYRNATACETLANLCAMTLYDLTANSPCDAFVKLQQANSYVPRVLYAENIAEVVLKETSVAKGISQQFSLQSEDEHNSFRFWKSSFSATGDFMGLTRTSLHIFHLCGTTDLKAKAAETFGFNYEISCVRGASSFWTDEPASPTFHELFLESLADGAVSLYPVPVRVLNLKISGAKPNEGATKNWQLVTRFHLVDRLSGVPSGGGEAKFVRVATRIALHISLAKSEAADAAEGRILPPYLEVEYTTLDRESDFIKNTDVSISFKVQYHADVTEIKDSVEIAAAVLGVFAAIISFVQTWSWYKRSGRFTIDFIAILKFLLFGCGNVANVFFVIVFGCCFWWLTFYKNQSLPHTLLPSTSDDGIVVPFLISAVILKTIQVIHMIYCQVTVDTFFIDWEHPRSSKGHGKMTLASIPTTGANNSEKSSGDAMVPMSEDVKSSAPPPNAKQLTVSIWRTYFVANEWNEIQHLRKTSVGLQLLITLFVLKVLKFEEMASADPIGDLNSNSHYRSPQNSLLRFAIAAAIYLVLGLVQWIFYTVLYERFLESKLHNFVDFCSMANVSVFVMSENNFGHYIHGRSVHGNADTGMLQMHENLKREESDLCGQRGLLPNSDQQTYQITVPPAVREKYDRVLANYRIASSTTRAARAGQPGSAFETMVESYRRLNDFFKYFIDHNLRDVDYITTERKFLESVLDAELNQFDDRAIFYSDDGTSFRNVMFLGNESTLLMFDILVFCTIDFFAQDFVTATILTFLLAWVKSLGEN